MGRSQRNENQNETSKHRVSERNILSQTSDVSSLNDSPFVDNPSCRKKQDQSYSDDDAAINTEHCDVSETEEASQTTNVVDANRISIFEYPEWITLIKTPYISKNGQQKYK